MGKVIQALASDPQSIIYLLQFLPSLVGIILTIMIARLVSKHVKGTPSNMVVGGAILTVLNTILLSLGSFLISIFGMSDYMTYYNICRIVGFFGQLFFLLGLLRILKLYLTKNTQVDLPEEYGEDRPLDMG